ncbi:MAG: dipeptidase [Steroidobacteraceae bacterium]|nr:dipeptidase [Steroidobacteraceae bacterium]
MARLHAIALLGLLAAAPAQAADDAALVHARELLDRVILFDGHNDLPIAIREDAVAKGDVSKYDLRVRARGNTDIPRLREGRLGAQFWSVYIPGEMGAGFARMELEQIAIARQVIADYPDAFRLAGTAEEIRAARRAGRIGSMLGIEGGHAIENSLPLLRAYYDLGVRYMGLTHNTHTDWADSAAQVPPRHNGLTPFGEDVVREMNRLGMLVDLAHASPDTMRAALRVTQAPVIWSHAGARGVCDVPRNVPDDVLQAVPKNGGVVMVTFVAGFVDCEIAKITQPAMARYNMARRAAKTEAEAKAARAEFEAIAQNLPPTPIGRVADHIEYIRRVAGVQHIGLGGDFDGNSAWPVGLSDVSMYPNLFAELVRRGWTDADLELLAGGNVLRVLEQAEAVSKRLQAR